MFWIHSKRTETPHTTPTTAYAQPQRSRSGIYVSVGVLSAIVALFVFPEVFGPQPRCWELAHGGWIVGSRVM